MGEIKKKSKRVKANQRLGAATHRKPRVESVYGFKAETTFEDKPVIVMAIVDGWAMVKGDGLPYTCTIDELVYPDDVPLKKDVLLDSAYVGIDPTFERGRVCRGAYITDGRGMWYLTHDGEWTLGIRGDENWWTNKSDAKCFLRERKMKNDTIGEKK